MPRLRRSAHAQHDAKQLLPYVATG